MQQEDESRESAPGRADVPGDDWWDSYEIAGLRLRLIESLGSHAAIVRGHIAADLLAPLVDSELTDPGGVARSTVVHGWAVEGIAGGSAVVDASTPGAYPVTVLTGCSSYEWRYAKQTMEHLAYEARRAFPSSAHPGVTGFAQSWADTEYVDELRTDGDRRGGSLVDWDLRTRCIWEDDGFSTASVGSLHLAIEGTARWFVEPGQLDAWTSRPLVTLVEPVVAGFHVVGAVTQGVTLRCEVDDGAEALRVIEVQQY